MHVHRRTNRPSGVVLCSLMVLSLGGAVVARDVRGRSVLPGATAAAPANVAFLYHQDPEIRMATVRALAARRDSSLLDDLIRAYRIEWYTEVRNVYEEVLGEWTGQRLQDPTAWKAWLRTQVESGRLTLDYQPIVSAGLDPNQRNSLDPLALRLGPEHFARFAEIIRDKSSRNDDLLDAVRYLVANDHLDSVRQFLGGEWLSQCLSHNEVDIGHVVYLLVSEADPGPLRERLHDQVRRCLESKDPVVASRILRLLGLAERGWAPGSWNPGVVDAARALAASPNPEVAVRAQLAMLRLDPRFSVPGAAQTPPVYVAFLYHQDPDVRAAAVRVLAAGRDPGLMDDLIRAYSVELYASVCNAYERVLSEWAGERLPGPGAWKAWLQAQVDSGKLTIDYRPILPAGLDPNLRDHLDPLALRSGPEHLDHFADILRGRWSNRQEFWQALCYMAINDHLEQTREFLGSEWLSQCLARKDVDVYVLNLYLHFLANPGLLSERLGAQVGRCLESRDAAVLVNSLRLLAGSETGASGSGVPGVVERVRALLANPDPAVATAARRALGVIESRSGAEPGRYTPNPARTTQLRRTTEAVNSGPVARSVSYAEALRDLHVTLGRQYPCFALKGIDWEGVGRELLPRVETVKTDEEFGRLCLELVARLRDSHAILLDGSAKVPQPAFPLWDGGFACLEDDQGRAVVYFLVPAGPAARAGLAIGQIVTHINDQPVAAAIEKATRVYSTYVGYSSNRYLRYHAFRFFARQDAQDAPISLNVVDPQGNQHQCKMQASLKVGYQPRLPVPSAGIGDAGSVSWKRLEDDIGYIYVRRISGDLIEQLDRAVGDLKTVRGLIIDVRGNSGGGFDSARAHQNFAREAGGVEPGRPRFPGPMALLIDERCISAGEGWASWFIACQRARVFGQTTAGASSRKTEYALKNGLYKVSFPVKAYPGFLDRPIEYRGLEPDVPLRPTAQDIAQGRDTVLRAAKSYLLTQPPQP